MHERLVQRHGGVAEPADTAPVAECVAQRLTEDDRGVLDGMVRVDLEIADGLHPQVDQRVLGQRVQHVVVEPDPGGDVATAGAVQVDLDDDLGLAGLAFDPRGAAHRWSSKPVAFSNATRKVAISPGVPTETRSQPSGPVSRINTPSSSSRRHTSCRYGNVPNSTKLASESTA